METHAYLFLNEVVDDYYPGSEDLLLRQLTERTVVAEGRYNPDFTEENPLYERLDAHESIPAVAWMDCKVDWENNLLYHPDHHYGYEQIRIQVDLIAKHKEPNLTGRPRQYEWDRFWSRIAFQCHEHTQSRNARQWARELVNDPNIWGLRIPDEQTLARKIREFYSLYPTVKPPRS